MVQTVRTMAIQADQKKIAFEKPLVLTRIFFFMLDGNITKFEADGQDIFQGDIWVHNLADTIQFYSLTEILR